MENYIKESTMMGIINGDIDKIEESDLLSLKSKIKEIEKKIKEKNKPKTITISGDIHAKLKKYCTILNLNIGEFTEKIIIKELEKNNFLINDDNCLIIENKDYGKIIEEISKEISDRWIKENLKKKYFIKSNILLSSKWLKFSGYSSIDGKPIYEFLGDDINNFKIKNNFDEIGVTFSFVDEKEISKDILFNEEISDIKFLE